MLPQEAKRLGLGRSLFERLQRSAHPVTMPHTQLPIPRLYLACISPDQVTMLQTQFRMHPAIRAFPSRHFYGNRLVDADAVALLASRSPGAEGGSPGFL